MPKKTLEASHKIISVTLLPTGRLIMATEKRMYELVAGVWEPMTFADDPVEPELVETSTSTDSDTGESQL